MVPQSEKTQEALRIAEEAVEEVLCNSRLIKDICRAFGCDDPEGVAPLVDTTGLMPNLGRAIVADVVRAGRQSLSTNDFPASLDTGGQFLNLNRNNAKFSGFAKSTVVPRLRGQKIL
jgi:hypothetical protein